MSVNGQGNIAVATSDADNEVKFDYRFTDMSGGDYGHAILRFESGDDYLSILIAPTYLLLRSVVSGTATTLDTAYVSTTEDQWYTLRAECDGSDVTVWRSTEGELETEELTTDSAAPTATDDVVLGMYNDTMSTSPFQYDNVRILADDLDDTTTFTVNSSNEVTAMADFNGTTNFSYDPWGRMTKKNVSTTYTANYYYNYGSELTKTSSDFPGEGTVTYEYGGDRKRRERTVGGASTWYNWDAGFAVVNEESGTGSGTLEKTYVDAKSGGMAEVAGSSPATGTYSYYTTDNLGSPRAAYDGSKALAAEFDYTPYGQAYADNDTIGITHRYTGHDWDAAADLYFAPYRFYNPQFARWLTRDPLGMVDGLNIYGYAKLDPIISADRLGMSSDLPGMQFARCLYGLIRCVLAKVLGTVYDGKPRSLKKCIDDYKDCMTVPPPDDDGGGEGEDEGLPDNVIRINHLLRPEPYDKAAYIHLPRIHAIHLPSIPVPWFEDANDACGE